MIKAMLLVLSRQFYLSLPSLEKISSPYSNLVILILYLSPFGFTHALSSLNLTS